MVFSLTKPALENQKTIKFGGICVYGFEKKIIQVKLS